MKPFKSSRHALAYLMGVYLSDGFIHKRHGCFGLDVADEGFRDTTAQAMRMVDSRVSLRPYQPKTPGWKRRYRLGERVPYPVGLWLERTFPSGRDHLPLSYITDDIVRDLVAGIMDGDGTIWPQKTSRQYHLRVCGYSDYLDDLQELFAGHGVLMHYRPEACSHTINIKSFVKAGFYFRMLRKQVLLEAYQKEWVLEESHQGRQIKARGGH